MIPLKTLQTDSAQADALFAKLAETSPGAAKTRERLFEELKEEIQLLTRLEHDHLIPALKKHAGTKTIVAQSGERSSELKALLDRLEQAPKDGEAFLTQVAELKAAFEQHLKDEKTALLPKVQKALSDEEIRTVAERIETDRAEVAATGRHEAEVQRAEARRQREQEAARQEAAEAAEREVRRLARAERAAAQAAEQEAREAAEAAEREARRVARAERAVAQAAEQEAREAAEQAARATTLPVDTVRAGAGAVLRASAQGAQRSMDQMTQLFGAVGESTRSFAAVAQSGAAFSEAAREASREWTLWAQTRAKNQAAGFGALMQCRTPQDLIALQGRLVREEMELLLGASARVSALAADKTQDAARSLTREG